MAKEKEGATSPAPEAENGAEIEEQAVYELGFLLVPTIPEENIEKEAGAIREIIEQGGSIRSQEAPKPIQLAYPMEKHAKGKKQTFTTALFGHVIFNTFPSVIKEMEEKLAGQETLVRFLLIKRTEKSLVAASAPRQTYQKKSADAKEKQKMDEGQVDTAIEELVAE